MRVPWLDSDRMATSYSRMGRVGMGRFFHLVFVVMVIGFMFVVRWYRVKGNYIIKVRPKLGNCLLPSQPHSHLPYVLFLVTCSICVLCIIDVQPLWGLCVISIQ